jgi:hypothetical protein
MWRLKFSCERSEVLVLAGAKFQAVDLLARAISGWPV